ncbi:MAG: AAA family ATPase [Prolixibacteraceae bacterium]|nr:AAA family ATPase [Prolixibacteraceae bacterium]
MEKSRLIIRNIGAIKDVEINLNKINVFIGEQGSGKSTIAKIISYLSWVGKEIALDYDSEYFLKENVFYDNFVSFHKMEGYFMDNSYIEYENPVMKLSYLHSEKIPKIQIIDIKKYKGVKISYIPAERNIVASIPNWFDVKLPDNNIRSFMSDWEVARKKKNAKEPMKIGSEIKYYYEDSGKRDIVKINEDVALDMTNVASGYQSLIPMYVVFDYVAKSVYEDEKDSVEQINKKKEAQNKILMHYLTKSFDEPFEKIVSRINKEFKNIKDIKEDTKDNTKSKYIDALNTAAVLSKQILKVQSSQLIIEEPEQNLYPNTQKKVIYEFLKIIKNSKKEISLTITTHSPYVLYALNNCILGGNVKDKYKGENLPSQESWIDPDSVSVWQINKGEVSCIQNKEFHTIGKQYFNDIMNEIMDEYQKILKDL